MTKYAQQHLFAYGWDYVGEDNGDRLLYDTFYEANEDLKASMPDLKKMGYNTSEWRVVPYVPEDDTKDDL